MIRLKVAKIDELRRRQNLSLAELARRSGWTPRYFHRIWQETKAGQDPGFNIKKLNGLCRTLQCRPMTILEYEPDPLD